MSAAALRFGFNNIRVSASGLAGFAPAGLGFKGGVGKWTADGRTDGWMIMNFDTRVPFFWGAADGILAPFVGWFGNDALYDVVASPDG